MQNTPETILKTVFGYQQFRPLQREVIENVLRKRDSLAIMPTGGGKSLCYQIPALLSAGLTVVVSPLIALMKDQVEQLNAMGVPALFLNSSLSFEEYRENMNLVRSGQVRLLYVAPETLLTPRLFDLLSEVKVDCLTIDEAHCISEWGHDFRPEYRQLVQARGHFPQAVCLALTATATPRVRQDIQGTLGFDKGNEFLASFDRENLFIEVQPKTEPASQTLEFLQRFKGQSGIIYCFSRKQVDDLTGFLSRQGYSTLPYHAGLEDEQRKQNQERFIRDDVDIMVATIAFGMGINKPNVRFIVHYDLPKSIESYYQEIGRAGRDGLPSHCLLLYSFGDVQKIKYFIEQKEETEKQVAYQHLSALTRYAESDGCRRVPLLGYFGETYTAENCGMCDNCLAGERESIDLTVPAHKFISCVKRTGETFGAVHVVDVLLGSNNQKVLKFNHQTLSTYGIGSELSRQQWLHLGRQLVQQGLLSQDDRYGSLKLTPKAYEMLRSKEPISGHKLEDDSRKRPAKKPGEIEHDGVLFERLRQERKSLADAAGVPPYVIFSDKTLVEMAAYYPHSPESLLLVSGVGDVKLERYGQIFLDLIAAYCQEHSLQEKPNPRRAAASPPPGQMALKPRYVEVGEAYNTGQSPASLADHYQVQVSTILDNLMRYCQDGNPLRVSDDFWNYSSLPEAHKAQVAEAFEALGVERLRPVFDRLDGQVSFDDLKVLRLHVLCRKTAPGALDTGGKQA